MKRQYVIWGIIGLLIAAIIAINWKAIFKPQPTMLPGANGDIGAGGSTPTGTGSSTTGGTKPAGTGSTGGGSSSTGNTTGSGDEIPKALVAAIYDDCTCTVCLRNNSLYTQLYYLSNKQFGLAYAYWDVIYKNKTNMSMAAMIADQSSYFNTEFANQQKQLAARFAQMGLS